MRCRFLWFVASVLVVLQAGGTPDQNQLKSILDGFASANPAERSVLSGRLQAFAEQYPMYFLQNGARLYMETTDVETRQHIEETLFPLVREHVYDRPHGFIGINMAWEPLPPEWKMEQPVAIRIRNVLEGHPASHAGIQDGDWILELNGIPVDELKSVEGFIDYVASLPPGMLLDLTLRRGVEETSIELILGARPGSSPRFGPDWSQAAETYFRVWLEELSADTEGWDYPEGHFGRRDSEVDL